MELYVIICVTTRLVVLTIAALLLLFKLNVRGYETAMALLFLTIIGVPRDIVTDVLILILMFIWTVAMTLISDGKRRTRITIQVGVVLFFIALSYSIYVEINATTEGDVYGYPVLQSIQGIER